VKKCKELSKAFGLLVATSAGMLSAYQLLLPGTNKILVRSDFLQNGAKENPGVNSIGT